jgi:hypothetical protein
MNVMDDRRDLLRFARRARARQRLVRGVEGALRALFWTLGLACLAVALHRLLGTPLPVAIGAAALGGMVVLWALLAAYLPRLDLLQAAAAVDEKAGWKERLSSAIALPTTDHPMERALVDDVRARLGKQAPSGLFPLRAPRELKWAPLWLLGIAAAWFIVPKADLLGFQAKEREKEKSKELIAEALEKLEKRKEELAKGDASYEKIKDALKKIDALAQDLQKTPPPEKKDVLAQISKLSEELAKLKNELAKSEALAEKLQKAMARESGDAGELGEKIKEGRFREAAQELAKLRNKLQEGKLSEKEKEKLQEQMEKLAEKLSKDKELSEFEKKVQQALQGLELGKEQMMDGLQQGLQALDGELAQEDMLAEALKDLENLADALAKGEGDCPGCGKEKKEGG